MVPARATEDVVKCMIPLMSTVNILSTLLTIDSRHEPGPLSSAVPKVLWNSAFATVAQMVTFLQP